MEGLAMNELEMIKRFFATYEFSEKEKAVIESYNGKESELLYRCYINTDLDLNVENLYSIFQANFI